MVLAVLGRSPRFPFILILVLKLVSALCVWQQREEMQQVILFISHENDVREILK